MPSSLLAGPTQAQQSGLRGERTSSKMDELCRLRRSEGYGACEDEALVIYPPSPP